MLEINESYPGIEVSANFVLGAGLPAGHLPSIVLLAGGKLPRFREKGALYLSPLMDGSPLRKGSKKELLRDFREVKMRARLPTFLYLIQRL